METTERTSTGIDGRPIAATERTSKGIDGIPVGWFALRVLWVAAQVILIVCLGRKGVLFFYQAF